jgi:hypothetical protein
VATGGQLQRDGLGDTLVEYLNDLQRLLSAWRATSADSTNMVTPISASSTCQGQSLGQTRAFPLRLRPSPARRPGPATPARCASTQATSPGSWQAGPRA